MNAGTHQRKHGEDWVCGGGVLGETAAKRAGTGWAAATVSSGRMMTRTERPAVYIRRETRRAANVIVVAARRARSAALAPGGGGGGRPRRPAVASPGGRDRPVPRVPPRASGSRHRRLQGRPTVRRSRAPTPCGRLPVTLAIFEKHVREPERRGRRPGTGPRSRRNVDAVASVRSDATRT